MSPSTNSNPNENNNNNNKKNENPRELELIQHNQNFIQEEEKKEEQIIDIGSESNLSEISSNNQKNNDFAEKVLKINLLLSSS